MSCRLKHLAVAAAIIGLATQTWADSGYFPGSTDFEGDNTLTNALWVSASIGDAEIVPDTTVTDINQAANKPSDFDANNRTAVLYVDNETDAPIVRNLKSGGAAPSVTTNVYADVLIKGTPLANDAAAPTAGSNDKLLVYTRISSDALATNLCVLAKETANSVATNEFVLTKSIGKDEWHRLVIVAKTDGTYQLYCDDFTNPCTTGSVNAFYPINGTASMSSVAFAGTGYVDDIILSTFNPVDPIYTLTWGEGFSTVSYTVNDVPGDPLTAADGEYQFQAPAGATVVLTGNTGYRTLTETGTGAASPIELAGQTGIAKYFPRTATADQDGSANNPFEIEDIDDLEALAAAATAGALAGGEFHFIQTANIDMSTADPFEGIGAVGAENATTLTMNAFEGVYDGNNKTISNITFTNRKGSALFNLVRNATIKDLTVDTVSYEAPFAAAKLGGAMIVGNGVNCTLQHLVTLGSNGLNNPSTYNAAGIANRLEGRGGPVRVIGCTNNAAIYGCYSKIAGICPIIEGENADGTITFVDCANNGNIVANGTAEQLALSGKTPGVDGAAGILAYAQHGSNFIFLTNCVNTGTISGVSGSAIGTIVGKTSTGVAVSGGSAQADVCSVGNGANYVSGCKFATVDNGVATFVADDALAADNTYKVMAGNATATYEFTAPGSISFNTALATPTYAITSSGLAGNVTSATEAPVTTYTAGYFPRTATAGQDGSAANPFEIADVDDLQALKAAFAAAASWRSLNYKVVADIDATTLGYWEGISSAASSANDTGLCGGTFDGDGHTISVKFTNAKYRGFFNHVNNHATIKNLTINVTDIQQHSDPEAEHGYGAFVGNIANATLLNCVATGTIGTTAKPAMHTCGGFAVKVVNGVFVNCTNHADIVCSLPDNPKIGGIIGLSFQGSSLTNCYNDGTMTITLKQCGDASNGAGGLIGLAQSNPVKIHNCGNAGTVQSTDTTAYTGSEPKDVKVGTIIGMSASAVTVTGGTIAQADAAPAGARANITGLDFATVDNNVATFVSTLVAGNTYKVMLSGATATYAFAEAGTIAFNEAMYQPTYAITAAEGLDLSDDTVNNVKTYTATVSAPAYPTYLADADATIKAKYDTWKVTNGTDTESAYEAAFLLNANPQNLPIGAAYLKIASITQVSGGWELEIVSDATTLTAESNSSGLVGNGYLAIVYAADLATLASGGTAVNLPVTVTDGHITVTVTAQNAKFMKATLSCTAVANE